MTTYDQSYYTLNNYSSYLDRYDRYERLASELHHDFLNKVGLGNSQELNVLDYGCAVGFVVKALLGLGYRNVSGFDVSEWAVGYGREKLGLCDRLTTDKGRVFNQKWDLVLALDVLEHMNIEEMLELLTTATIDNLIVRVPVTHETHGKFVLQVSENDPTHVVRWTKADWLNFFADAGYAPVVPLRLNHIYDTPGVMCGMFRRREAKAPFQNLTT